jgi:hypothetical protein
VSERLYILATDLARVRIMEEILRQMNDSGIDHDHPIFVADLDEVIGIARRWRLELEAAVQQEGGE